MPELFLTSSFISRLGCMYLLMSFIGSVGDLMEESGLEAMSSVFVGVKQMHNLKQIQTTDIQSHCYDGKTIRESTEKYNL